MKQKTLATYEYLIKVPKDGENSHVAMKCNHCSKFFESEFYLRKHFEKKHPGSPFDQEYPTKVEVQKQREAS